MSALHEVGPTVGSGVLNEAMDGLVNPAESLDNRVAFYGLLHQVQLRINRVLRQAKKDGLAEEIIRVDPEGIGPVKVQWVPFDVEWPANDPDNWTDAQLQEELSVYSLIAPDYIRHVPDHFEIATAALGEGVANADPVAHELHRVCKDRKWRREGGRRAALKVTEVRIPPKGKED
jgi:hypothetical protein